LLTPFRAVFAIFFFVLLSYSTTLLTGCGSPSFPALASGTYAGTITGIIKGAEQPFSFYAEKLGTNNSLLLVIFADGWNPQVVALQQKKSGGIAPLSVTHDNVSYVLSGSGSDDSFSGIVTSSDGRKGQWNLSTIGAKALKQNINADFTSFKLEDWLQTKVRYNAVRDEISELRISHEQDMAKLEKLQRFVKNEDVLKDRSRTRKDALTTELNRITEQRKKFSEELKNALSDVVLLQHMTKVGQATDLNRRIARRENKWYSINWSSEGNPGDIEEQLAEQEHVDLKKLNVAVRHAEEIDRLRQTISDEQYRIAQLETTLQQRTQPIARPEPAPRKTPQKEDKPWWRLWDGGDL